MSFFNFNFFGGLDRVGHSFAYVAHLLFLRDVWIRTQSAAVASWCATDWATHPSTKPNIPHPITSYSRRVCPVASRSSPAAVAALQKTFFLE